MKNFESLRFQHCLFKGESRTCILNFGIAHGQTLGIIDKRDASNPSLNDMLSGKWLPVSGSIFREDQKVIWHNRAEAERSGVFIVGKASRLIDTFSVDENISVLKRFSAADGIKPLHIGWRDVHAQTKAIFDSINVDLDTRQSIHQLSVSMRTIVEIVKAVSLGARIVILTNVHRVIPQSDLQLFKRVLSAMMQWGVSFIITSNVSDCMITLASRVLIFENDILSHEATMQELLEEAKSTFITDKNSSNASSEIRILGCGPQKDANYEFGMNRGELSCILTMKSKRVNDIGKWLYDPDPSDVMDRLTIMIDQKKLHISDSGAALKCGIGYISDESMSANIDALRFIDNVTLPYYNRKKGFIEAVGLRTLNRFVLKELYNELERYNCPIDKRILEEEKISHRDLQMQQKLVAAFYKLRSCHLKLLILDRLSVFDSFSDHTLLNSLIQSMLDQNTGVLLVADHMLSSNLIPQNTYMFVQDAFIGKYHQYPTT